MARIKWLGSFRDVTYGIDRDGEVFESIAEAKAALFERYATHGARQLRIVRPDGNVEEQFFPAVTPEARIMLWHLDPSDQVQTDDLPTQEIEVREYMSNLADRVVWIGRRHAVRFGTPAEYVVVEALRKGQDVREAGSIVVTS
jgi:hypothetical protein